MNKFLGIHQGALSINSYSDPYRDDYYGREDDYYYPPPERRRAPMPPRRRPEEAPRRSNGGWEPGYYKNDKSKKLKDPKDSSRFVFNFFKITTQILLIITALAFLVSSICYILIGILSSSQMSTLNSNYFTDILGVSWIFGSMAGIVTGILFLILYLLMIINRKGWLRKSGLKSHLSCILTLVIVTLVSVYFLFTSSSLKWQSIGNYQLSFTDESIANIISTVTKPIVDLMKGNSFINGLVNTFYNNKLGIIGSGIVFLGIDIVAIIFGSLYFKSVNSTLEDSIDYFEERKRRY